MQNKKLGGFSLSKNHITTYQLINMHFMERKYIEYKIAEYPQMTDKGLAWMVLYRIEYIN